MSPYVLLMANIDTTDFMDDSNLVTDFFSYLTELKTKIVFEFSPTKSIY
jgi:hypothetical protein